MSAALALPEVLTLREATSALASLLSGMAPHLPGKTVPSSIPEMVASPVCINAQPLRKFDSSALAVLLECRRVALEGGRGFRVDHLPQALQGLASVYGVAALIVSGAN